MSYKVKLKGIRIYIIELIASLNNGNPVLNKDIILFLVLMLSLL